MIDPPRIVRMTPQHTAVLHLTIPRSQIQQVMGPGLQEVIAAAEAQGLNPVGPWYTHHFRLDPEVFEFEICVPVDRPFAPAGRVRPGEVLTATVARTVYRGPFEGLPDAWGEFSEWIETEGLATGPDIWEVYLSGPEVSGDPADWKTELNRLVVNG